MHQMIERICAAPLKSPRNITHLPIPTRLPEVAFYRRWVGETSSFERERRKEASFGRILAGCSSADERYQYPLLCPSLPTLPLDSSSSNVKSGC
jgi:hypothetical protein